MKIMPRYVRVLETAIGTPRVSDTLAQWVDVDDLIEIPEGGGSVSLETPTGDVDGVNDEFVFVGTPLAVILNGIIQKPTTEVVISGNTATFVTPPPATQGAWVGGLVS